MSERLVARQFGRTANVYAESETRRYPADLVLGLCAPGSNDVAVDIGMGPGTLAGILAPNVRRIYGTDVTPEMIDLCRTRESGCVCILADAHRLPFGDGVFTIATCGSVFHHLEEPALAIEEAARVLRPGGRFLLIDMAGPENVSRRAARDEVERVRDPSHVRILAPSQVHEMLEQSGFDLKEEERQVEDKRDEEWVTLAGGDLEAVRATLRRLEPLAGGFLALRWEGDGYVFRRERAYYLAVKR